MLRLNKTNFLNYVQEVLEKYYLQPLDGSTKSSLKDGYIERSIHGAMHASRATLWALVMHNLLLQIAPTYVNTSLKKIAQHINVDINSVVLIILITMTFHDTGRKGETDDKWEKESSVIASQLLKDMGLNEDQAALFAKAIVYKDEPDKYFAALKQFGISLEDINTFDYIRKIVNLGDNLDLVRCVGQFESQYIFNTLSTIEDFNVISHENMIMNLIKTIHQFVYDQHDMRFACTVEDRNKAIVAMHPSRLSNKEKVKYEHADNVFAVIFEEASQISYLQPYLDNHGIVVTKSKKHAGGVKFNPFIHGTNASIFSTLRKSDYQIMSTLEMMDEYQTAPMTGELAKGGYDIVGDACIKDEDIGRTSFAKIIPESSSKLLNPYSLETVLSKYTSLNVSSKEKSLVDFKKALASGLNCAFSNINLLLIYFTRARQTHGSVEQIITEGELKDFQTNLNATIQFYYFIQLLGTHIHPAFDAIEKSGMAIDITDCASTLLRFEYIIKKILSLKLT